ncbi:12168_t:CDS:2, partial [Funneliformis geosporum]
TTNGGTGTISGGTFGVEFFTSKKRDQKNGLQLIYNIQIPPPRDETDSDDNFDADNRDPKNFKFDEYLDSDDSNDDDDQERAFLGDSVTFDESEEDNSVNLFFFLSV